MMHSIYTSLSLSFSFSITYSIQHSFFKWADFKQLLCCVHFYRMGWLVGTSQSHTFTRSNISLFKIRKPKFGTDFSQATLYHRVHNEITFISFNLNSIIRPVQNASINLPVYTWLSVTGRG